MKFDWNPLKDRLNSAKREVARSALFQHGKLPVSRQEFMSSDAMEKEGTAERIVSIYMVQIDERSFTMLRSRGLVDDESVDAYLREQAGISPPLEPTWGSVEILEETDDDDLDTIDWSIPVSQKPRVPPHCVPVAGDVYDFFQKLSGEPEREIARLMRRWAEETAQSQSRSR